MTENKELFQDYVQNMTELADCLHALRLKENDMITAAAEDATRSLDSLVQETQPDLLRFRGLEKKRVAHEKSLDIVGIHFDELLKKCTEEEAVILKPVLDALSVELKLFEQTHKNADTILKVRLFDIHTALKSVPTPEPFRDTLA